MSQKSESLSPLTESPLTSDSDIPEVETVKEVEQRQKRKRKEEKKAEKEAKQVEKDAKKARKADREAGTVAKAAEKLHRLHEEKLLKEQQAPVHTTRKAKAQGGWSSRITRALW